ARVHPVSSELSSAKQSLYCDMSFSNGFLSDSVLIASPNSNPKSTNSLSSGVFSNGVLIVFEITRVISTVFGSLQSVGSDITLLVVVMSFPKFCLRLYFSLRTSLLANVHIGS